VKERRPRWCGRMERVGEFIEGLTIGPLVTLA
jgi:hypothetical protein